jgi:hypothetical protein
MSNSKLLASGNGMGNSAVSTAWKYGIIEAIMGFACFIIAFYIQSIGDETSGQIRSSVTSSYSSPFRHAQVAQANQAVEEISTYISIGYYTMIIAGIFCIIWGICLGNNCAKKVKATNVNVYDDKVNGEAVDKDFSMAKLIFMCMGWDKSKLTNFDLAFNQITSVDVVDSNAIVINASRANYKCFVSNGLEIQSAINNKVRNVV